MKPALRILVSVSVLLVLTLVLPWDQLVEAAGAMSLSVYFVMAGGFVVVHALGVTKYRTMVNAGGAQLAWRDAVRCYCAGLFANICLPSIVGGDVLRAAMAGKAIGRMEQAVLSGAADRLLDVIALGALLIGGALAVGGGVLSGGPGAIVIGVIVAAIVVGLIALMIVMRRPLHRWPSPLRRRIARSGAALRRISRNRRAAGQAFLTAVIMQSILILIAAYIGRSIGIDVPLAVWFATWPLSKLTALIPISLGGLGVRDAALAGLLVPFGVPAAQGFVASLIWQVGLVSGGLLGGAIWRSVKPSKEQSDHG